jgi:energy-converting hydrogenase Eha subunit A
MGSRRVLVAVSGVQLAAGVAGQFVALRDRRSFDIALLGWRGQPERVARDSWWIGTALSAPVVMLGIQAAAAVRLGAGPSRTATRILGSLGATMACASLLEREVRGAPSPRAGIRRRRPSRRQASRSPSRWPRRACGSEPAAEAPERWKRPHLPQTGCAAAIRNCRGASKCR